MKIPWGYFLKDFTLIFFNFYMWEIKLNMPKNYGFNIFDYDGPRSLTHTIELQECFMDLGKLNFLMMVQF